MSKEDIRDEIRRTKLRAEIDIGLEQIKRGEVVDGREAIECIREKLRQRSRATRR